MSSSSSSFHESNSSFEDSADESGVVQSLPNNTKVECVVLVKGGGIDDSGIIYTMTYESKIVNIYVDLARRGWVTPSDLRLFYRGVYISPDDTPFAKDFTLSNIVLVYRRDCKTPIGVVERIEAENDTTIFTIQDCCTLQPITRYYLKRSTPMAALCMAWGRTKDKAGDKVTLYLDGKTLKGKETIEHANIYDGAILYGVVE
ncbi:putative pre-mRNA-splicing factor ATP-dependent RNA helicase mog-4 [Bienertia sinuspersici]